MPARSNQPDTPELGIGMVGYAFMGAAHSRAWATVGQAFDVPLRPRMTVLAGRGGAGTRGRRVPPPRGAPGGRGGGAGGGRPPGRRPAATAGVTPRPTGMR